MSTAAADITGLVFVWDFRAINLTEKGFFFFHVGLWGRLTYFFPLVYADGPMF